jgi:hypothetical protein
VEVWNPAWHEARPSEPVAASPSTATVGDRPALVVGALAAAVLPRGSSNVLRCAGLDW